MRLLVVVLSVLLALSMALNIYLYGVMTLDEFGTEQQGVAQKRSSIQQQPTIPQTVNAPSPIEIAFSNECNFKCGYCHPMHSSSYYQEIKKHGRVPDVNHHDCSIDWFDNLPEENNPYIDAW